MVPIVALRLFPAPVRFSGLSFSYNVSYAIFGGLTPVFLRSGCAPSRWRRRYYVGGLALLGMALAAFGSDLDFLVSHTTEDTMSPKRENRDLTP